MDEKSFIQNKLLSYEKTHGVLGVGNNKEIIGHLYDRLTCIIVFRYTLRIFDKVQTSAKRGKKTESVELYHPWNEYLGELKNFVSLSI